MKNSKIKTAVFNSVVLILFVSFSLLILSISIPNKALISKDENAESILPDSCKWIMSVKAEPSKAISQTASTRSSPTELQSYEATVYLCGLIPVKSVSVSVSDTVAVVPGGKTIGINLKLDGVLVTEHAPFTDQKGNDASPAEASGIKPGDTIEKINGIVIESTADASKVISESNGKLTIEGKRGKDASVWEVTPLPDYEGIPRLGLKIREAVSGIGTLTYYCNGSFAALGHPISDIDTGNKVEIKSGAIFPASIVAIDKGKKGEPGSLRGIFAGDKQGSVYSNSECGVFGAAPEPTAPKVTIAKTKEIHTGKATILCDIGSGVKEYSAKILRVMPGAEDTKGMIVEITDDALIEKTGGIVQGMSGSPVIQNGKLAGAVTHVFVNDPTRGYGIFIENMLAEAEKIK